MVSVFIAQLGMIPTDRALIYRSLPLMLAALGTQAVAALDTTVPVPAAPSPATLASPVAPIPAQAIVAAAPTPVPDMPSCELHIWPAERVAAQTNGAGAGFGLIGAMIDLAAHPDQNKRDTAFITGALDAKRPSESPA